VGALTSHVDLLIEMHWYASPESDDRRRWLRAYSRFAETPRHLVLELSPAGNDYRAHAFAGPEQLLSALRAGELLSHLLERHGVHDSRNDAQRKADSPNGHDICDAPLVRFDPTINEGN
jgi:hypothetical protein